SRGSPAHEIDGLGAAGASWADPNRNRAQAQSVVPKATGRNDTLSGRPAANIHMVCRVAPAGPISDDDTVPKPPGPSISIAPLSAAAESRPGSASLVAQPAQSPAPGSGTGAARN